MTPVDYIRVDAEILRLQVCDKAKFLLGLIKSFNNKGLMMSNPELGKLLNCSSNSIKRALKEIEENIRIENAQSKYRKIFYSRINEPVETKALAQKCTSRAESTGSNTTPTGSNAPRTGANMSHITKGTKKTKREKDSLPLDGDNVNELSNPEQLSQPDTQELPELLTAYQEKYPEDPHRFVSAEQQAFNERCNAAIRTETENVS